MSPRGVKNLPLNLDLITTRYRVVSDNDGHDYVIEPKDEQAFYKWVEAMEEGFNFDGLDFEVRRVNCSGWTFTDPQGWK